MPEPLRAPVMAASMLMLTLGLALAVIDAVHPTVSAVLVVAATVYYLVFETTFRVSIE